MNEAALAMSAVGLGATFLIGLLGLVVYQVKWQTAQTIYSKDHAKEIGEVKAQVLKMNGTQQEHTVEIAQLQTLSHPGPQPPL